jgi:hypothetical protein
MRRGGTSIILGVAVASWFAIACTAGVSGAPNFDENTYDRPPSSRDRPPTSGRESVPSSRDVPELSTDNPGTQGGGNCPPCDGKFRCTGTVDGKASNSSSSIKLQTVNGECRVVDDDDVAIIACGGAIITNGKNVGTWSSSSSNSFTAIGTGTVTINGERQQQTVTVTLTCTRDSGGTTQPVPTATVTAVPLPTTTGTSRPPTVTDAGPAPFDSGSGFDSGGGQ